MSDAATQKRPRRWGRRRWLLAGLGGIASLALGTAGKLAGRSIRTVAGRVLRLRPFHAQELDRPHDWAG